VIYRGPNTAHGRGTPPAGPAWLSDISAGTWGSLPNSTLSASGVGWAGTSPGAASGNYTAIVNAYSGGVLNTVGCYYSGAFHAGNFLVIFGGGHGDYAGNEVYAYGPLEDESPAWHRLTDPTLGCVSDASRNSGQPCSRHTYDAIQFLPATNKMVTMSAPGVWSLGNSKLVSDLFNFADNTWAANDTGFIATVGGSGTVDAQGGYNSTTGKAWCLFPGNSTKIISFDQATEAWTNHNADNPNYSSQSKGAICETHNLLVMLKATGAVMYKDLASPATAFVTPTVSGTAPSAGKWTLDWDSGNTRFVAWDQSGTTVYFLTVPATPSIGTWEWTSASGIGGTTPGSATGTAGTYGRFRAVPSLGGALLMSNHNTAISFYKF
jgi:hypothetical protein